MAGFEVFSWDEDPAFAGDKKPDSEDDIPCGEHYIPSDKDCHDGKAHRPEKGENPYWSGDNSAEERNERGEGWESTKPKTQKEAPEEPEVEPEEEIEPELEPDEVEPEIEPEEAPTEPQLQDYANEHQKALDPARQNQQIPVHEVPRQHKAMKQVAGKLLILGNAAQLAAAATRRYDQSLEMDALQDELNEWAHMEVTDFASLEDYRSKLGELWAKVQENPVSRAMLDGRQSFNNMNFADNNFPLKGREIQHTFDAFDAAKREDDPRDILKWNTLAAKPEMMSFDDIPDLAWREFPDGPQNDKDLQFIEHKMQSMRNAFETWAQTGGQTNGTYLAEMLMGKPTEMGHMINQSPLLPNPKAAQMILDRSARSGDEAANDMMWNTFGRSEQWSPNSYLHDYKLAVPKAREELKQLGLDLDVIKAESDKYNKMMSEFKALASDTHIALRELDEEMDKLELEERSTEEGSPLINLLEQKDILIEHRTKKAEAVAVVKKALEEKIETQRMGLTSTLIEANEATRVDDETFGRIANSFAAIQFAELDPNDDEYLSERTGRMSREGKKLLKARQQARTAGVTDLGENREECEEVLAHLTSMLHKDLLSTDRDAANGDLTEISWRFDKHLRAYARKDENDLALDIDTDGGVLAHEFAHHVEFRNERVHQRILDFYDDRTIGQKPRRLPKRPKHERYKLGDFFDSYVGRHYGVRKPQHDDPSNPHTEVLSMGIQALYTPSMFKDLALKDPEHLALVIATVRGY